MKLCFYQRITLIVVGVFMLILIMFFAGSSYLQKQTRYEAEQVLHQDLAHHLVEDSPLLSNGVYDHEALKNSFHMLMLLGPGFEFYYLNKDGKVLTHSTHKSQPVVREAIDLKPIQSYINKDKDFPVFADDPKDSDRQKIFSAAPIYNEGQLQGYLYVIIGGQDYDSILSELQNSQSLREFFMFVGAGLIAILVVLLVLFKLITAPLRNLVKDVAEFREAGYRLEKAKLSGHKWCVDSNSEIDRLGCAFSDLFHHVDAQFHALERINEQRKEMLADISHDLRTPLASMKGYIETLHLQGDTLSREDQQRFISICMRNMNNLKLLIDQIFELAYLEGGQVTIQKEACAIGEFLFDITSKFSLDAKNKNITLRLEPGQIEGYVNTDMGKLERILSNLIDNAIRHTQPGGQVTLFVEETNSGFNVGVEDTGVGIAENELESIFTPRYQASNTQKQDGKNVGLGLAISQKLVSLLNSDLTVKSKYGKGTTFSFSLPQA
ncbi:sensor histidine kinase [Alteromonas sp. 5E99-2]|nr:sensor histidine kinase [Alteromonas sp. 5E99-2]